MHSDRTTQQAIAAAAYEAISRLAGADTILITRVVAEGQGSGRVCATIHGRGVRLIKDGESSEPEEDDEPEQKPDTDALQ